MSKKKDELSIPEVLKGIAPGFGIDSALGGQFLNFNGDWIWTFNGEVGCIAPCPDSMPELYGAVDGKRLAHFISRAPKPDDILFHIRQTDKGPQLTVKSGRASVTLKWIEEAERMPDIPSRWKQAPDNFADAIGFSAHCCASHITRPLLTCVHVREDWVECSDGMRLIRHDLDGKLKGVDTLIPRNVAFLLQSTGVDKICPQSDMIWFKTKNGIRIFCPVISGDYPDIGRLIKAVPDDTSKFTLPFEVKTDKEIIKLEDALDRARVFEGDEEELRIVLSIQNNRMRMEAEDSVGKYQERISIKDFPPDLSVKVQMYAHHLLDLVKQGKEVECETSEDRMWMRTDNWEFLSVIEVPSE